MWFKNLQIFRIANTEMPDIHELESALKKGVAIPCPSNQPSSAGWVPPVDNGPLVHTVGRQWLIALQVEERILPASVINEEVEKRAKAQEKARGFPPGRKQRREIKELVIDELLPRAFTKKRKTFVWIDPENKTLVIDAPSESKAIEVIGTLMDCNFDIVVEYMPVATSPQSAMADWLASGETPDGFTVDQDCELKSIADDKSAVKYANSSLEDGMGVGGQIKEHLAAGKLPTRIAMTWDNRISFVLTDNLEVKRLVFLDVIKEQAAQDAESAADQFDTDFAMMTGELQRFIPALVDALGGEIKGDNE